MKLSIYHPLLLLIVIIWGFNIVGLRYLVLNLPPMTMTSLRIFTAGFTILLFLLIQRRKIRLTSTQLINISVISLFGVVGHHSLLALGLHQTSASNTGVILGLLPLIVSLLSIFFLQVRFTWSKLIGFVLGFMGVVFIIVQNPANLSVQLGDVYIFLCVLSQGVSFILLKKAMYSLPPAIVTGWMFFLGSFGLFLISLFLEPQGLSHLFIKNGTVWSIFFTSAIVATASGHFLYNKAMQKIGSADAAIFINFSPFFTLLGSSFLLGETIHWSQIVGFLCVVMGVFLGIGLFDRSREKEKAPSQTIRA